MGILSGNQKNEPLHCGEVFDLSTFLSGGLGMVARYQVLINHTGDEDLRNLLKDIIDNQLRPHILELTEILKANGISLPPAPPERPSADLERIPAGARINDAEVAVTVAADLAAGLVACSQAMGKCTREDLAMMYGQYHMEKAQTGAKLLRMMKQKGWLVPPPLFVDTKIEG